MIHKIKIYLFLLCAFCTSSLFSQGKDSAEAYKKSYHEGDYEVSEVEILALITEYETNPDSILVYANILLEKAPNYTSKDSTLQAYRCGYLARYGHKDQ